MAKQMKKYMNSINTDFLSVFGGDIAVESAIVDLANLIGALAEANSAKRNYTITKEIVDKVNAAMADAIIALDRMLILFDFDHFQEE